MLEHGFIQAGGKSSRMGGVDKAWLKIGKASMIECLVETATPIVRNLSIIVNSQNGSLDRYLKLARRLKVEVIFDLHHHLGPMGGIHTGLGSCQASRTTACLMLACDLPMLTTGFLRLLASIHLAETKDLTVPVDAHGRPQPLAAVYSSGCFPVVERLLSQGQLKVNLIYGHVKTRLVPFSEFAHLPGAEYMLNNINSMEDYRNLLHS